MSFSTYQHLLVSAGNAEDQLIWVEHVRSQLEAIGIVRELTIDSLHWSAFIPVQPDIQALVCTILDQFCIKEPELSQRGFACTIVLQ
jgi:hypothetical protein